MNNYSFDFNPKNCNKIYFNELLILFENYYGKDATDYIKNNLSNKNKILLFDKLKHRIIGKYNYIFL